MSPQHDHDDQNHRDHDSAKGIILFVIVCIILAVFAIYCAVMK